MKITTKAAGALIALGLSVAASSALAGTVYNNFGPGDSFSDSGLILQGEGVGSIGDVDQAAAFTVGPHDYLLTSVSVGLGVGGPGPATGPLHLLIATDSVGLPGTTLATLVKDVTTTGKQVVTATGGGGLLLSAGTTYWLIADAKGTLDAGWGFNNTGAEGPTAGRSFPSAWSPHSDPKNLFAFRVEGREVARSTPDGGSLAFISAGVFGLMAWARRRTQA